MFEPQEFGNAIFIKTELETEDCQSDQECPAYFCQNVINKEPAHSDKSDSAVCSVRESEKAVKNANKMYKTQRKVSVQHLNCNASNVHPNDIKAKFLSAVFVDYSFESNKDIANSESTAQGKCPLINVERCLKKKKVKVKQRKKSKKKKAASLFDSSSSITEQKTPNKINECCACKKKFSSKSIKKHIQEHDSIFRVRCLICDETFTDLSQHQFHTKIHLTGQQFVCQSCGKTFRRGANLLRHEPMCGKDNPKAELCILCGKICQSKWQLKQHMMFHTDARPYPCDLCSKSFRFKTRLDEHQRTHLGIKPHTCDICKKCFTTSSDMKKHRSRHRDPNFRGYNTENNPNKVSECKVCNEKVVNLKSHMFNHYDKGKGTCNVCGKILNTKSLYQHIKIHLEGETYHCDVCNRTFNRKDNMLSHRKRHTKAG